LIPGSYPISSANKVSYTESGSSYNATGGTINITAYGNNKISGDFITSGSGAGYTSVNGQFVDIPKN
jgi:hypothetical protein